ncbi:hypothetical protein QAD02_021392 [Eretmocerus hayati]|uniref:Uncharacterized protein n=1 Tax=Eretmocerus hayati TaxID=131215 RepID=A0ACC2PPS9_9HYME|nr:hypothetical protein QAD02_021392 [Eretmocerus hayati]
MARDHEELERAGFRHGIEDFIINPSPVRVELRDGILTIRINLTTAGIIPPLVSAPVPGGSTLPSLSSALVPGISVPFSSNSLNSSLRFGSAVPREESCEVPSCEFSKDSDLLSKLDNDIEVDDEKDDIVMDNPFFSCGASLDDDEPSNDPAIAGQAPMSEGTKMDVECIPESARIVDRPRRKRRSATFSPVVDRPSTSRRRSANRASRVENDFLLREIQSRIEAELSAAPLESQEVEARLARLHQLAEYRRYDLQHGGRRRPEGARNRCYFCWGVVGPRSHSVSGLVCRACE